MTHLILAFLDSLHFPPSGLLHPGPPQGALILVLLQGEAPHVSDFMLRQRTELVDVDSRGRKCKERMMSVMLEQDVPCEASNTPAAHQHAGAGEACAQQSHTERRTAGGVTDSAAALPRHQPPIMATSFDLVDLSTAAELFQLLENAGLGAATVKAALGLS